MANLVDHLEASRQNPILEALRRAPVGKPFTPEQAAQLGQAMEDIAAGRVKLIANNGVPAWLEARSDAH